MVTEIQASPDLPVPVAPVSANALPAPEPTVDYKAQYEELLVAKVKVDGDLKAIKGLRQTEAQREAMLLGITDRLEGLDRQQTALIKALAANETDALPEEVERIQAEQLQTRASRGFVAQYNSLWEDFQESVNDEKGKPLFDLFKEPALADAVATWRQYYQADTMHPMERIAGFAKAVGQASRAVRQLEREQSKAAIQQEKVAAKATTKQKLEEAGALDLDTGPAAGGGANQSFDALMKKDPYKMSAQELREYRSAMAKAKR